MQTRLTHTVVLLLVVSTVRPASAQLAPPNDAGVTLGHMHLAVKDVEAQRRFWTTMMGGTVVQNGPLSLIQFPGVYIMLRQADPTGPPAGSLVLTDPWGTYIEVTEGLAPGGRR